MPRDDNTSDTSKYDVMILRETPDAYLCRFTDTTGREVEEWFPKSQLPLVQKASRNLPAAGRIEVPYWLAEKKGLTE